MTLYRSQTLPDGSTVVGDSDNPNVEVILKPGQWDQIAGLPDAEQRHRLREFLAANRADPTGGRTELDEQARETAQNASTGEAHEQDEEAR